MRYSNWFLFGLMLLIGVVCLIAGIASLVVAVIFWYAPYVGIGVMLLVLSLLALYIASVF